MPVAHADVDRQSEFSSQQVSLLQGAFGERGVTDESVTMFDFFDDLRGELAAPCDLQQKFRDVVDGIGAAVG